MRLAWLKLVVLALLLGAACCGCQRSLPAEQQHTTARADYPWQMPKWGQNLKRHDTAPVTPANAPEGQVSLPNDKGHHPKFDPQDTLDPALLPGTWLLVCYISNEQVILRAPTAMSIFEFSANGTFNLRPVAEGQVQPATPGTWEKSGPGMLLVSNKGAAPITYYCEMSGRDFLFMWNFDYQNGLWFVRRPDVSSERIARNDFTFENGDKLHLTQIQDTSFTGTIDGSAHMDVTGGYHQGVLSLRWIDKPHNVDGYAAFTVSSDWQELRGVEWLSDFTSSPFGELWQTSPAPATAPPPSAPSPTAPAPESTPAAAPPAAPPPGEPSPGLTPPPLPAGGV